MKYVRKPAARRARVRADATIATIAAAAGLGAGAPPAGAAPACSEVTPIVATRSGSQSLVVFTPGSAEVRTVSTGPLQFAGLAYDVNGVLWGASEDRPSELWTIDPGTGAARKVAGVHGQIPSATRIIAFAGCRTATSSR